MDGSGVKSRWLFRCGTAINLCCFCFLFTVEIQDSMYYMLRSNTFYIWLESLIEAMYAHSYSRNWKRIEKLYDQSKTMSQLNNLQEVVLA